MELLRPFLEYEQALNSLSFDALIYLVLAIVLFVIGKFMYDILTPYSINKELGDTDNKALAVTYGGYLVAQGIILIGVLSAEGKSLIQDLLDTSIWALAGIILLNISRVINDKLLLSQFDNTKEIIKDKNVGTGAVVAGGYIGTAFIIKSIVMGESDGIVADILGTVIFYILAQLLFILFGVIYQKITTYDLHDEIEKDNAAAGLAFGLTLSAIGIVMSHILITTSSIATFLVWYVNGLGCILIARFLVDKLILPKHKLDEEIARDRNWGIALIEGGSAVIVAFIINASF